MEEIRYIISDASKKIDVEQYTLRYWEEELNLDVKRNEMGHRYYREEDLEVFKSIKVLKDKGYQLRAIKMMLPEIIKMSKTGVENLEQLQEEWDKTQIIAEENQVIPTESGNKLEQFTIILENLVVQAIESNNELLAATITDTVTSSVSKEMEYLLRVKDEKEEERYKKFDRLLRDIQTGKHEVSYTKENKKKKLFFK